MALKDIDMMDLEDFYKHIEEYVEEDQINVAKDIIKDLFNLKQGEQNWEQLWGDLEKEFYEIEDLRKMITFIRQKTIQHYICKNKTCPIFPPLIQISGDLRFEKYTNLKDAKENLTSEDYKAYKKKYYNYAKEIDGVFSETHILFTTKMTQRHDKKLNEDRLVRIIKTCNDSNFPVPMKFQAVAQAAIDESAEDLYFNEDDSPEERAKKQNILDRKLAKMKKEKDKQKTGKK